MFVLRLLFALAVFLLPAFLLGGLVCRELSRTSRDEWKLLAWVPITPLVIWGVRMGWDVTRDRTSHNLWPFELVIWGALSLALVGLFLASRRLIVGPTPGPASPTGDPRRPS